MRPTANQSLSLLIALIWAAFVLAVGATIWALPVGIGVYCASARLLMRATRRP